jgi:hypothetical protein
MLPNPCPECPGLPWSAGILPARETSTCATNVWSAGILPARETSTCPTNVWSAGILPAGLLHLLYNFPFGRTSNLYARGVHY